jgi:hypothetical protein
MTPEEPFEKMRELAAVNLLQGIELKTSPNEGVQPRMTMD